MPVQPTYPGVYIEEIPSGVRTITGVATSITAFVGRARSGPVNEPITINSYGDFERIFGGLWVESTLGYAVRDFYLNGGGQAVIVRLFGPSWSSAGLKVSGLGLVAASPGTWGNELQAAIDWDVPTPDTGILFNLRVRVGSDGPSEMFRNVSVDIGHPRQVDKVLDAESKLVRAVLLPKTRPPATGPVVGSPADSPPAQSSPSASSPSPSSPTGSSPQDSPSFDSPSFDSPPFDSPPPVQGSPADSPPSEWEKVSQLASDGDHLTAGDFLGSESKKEGLFALEKTDLFNLLCLPPPKPGGTMDALVISDAAKYCERRRAMFIVDPPEGWNDKDKVKDKDTGAISIGVSKNAALFFPRLRQPNPLRGGQIEDFVPCGAVAGIFARTDAERGVWKAPAGLDATLVGVPALSVPLTDAENGELNPLGVNCLRVRVPVGPVVWGARTRQGDDRLASEWKYIPVRRLALYLEESLYRGTQWVVFEPNDEPLWSQIRLNIGAFMQSLFRQGAFQGRTPREAYLVKCDRETTTQDDINRGVVNILVGFAPLKPAEFVMIRIQQLAGQIQV